MLRPNTREGRTLGAKSKDGGTRHPVSARPVLGLQVVEAAHGAIDGARLVTHVPRGESSNRSLRGSTMRRPDTAVAHGS
jgi:hypothetical protein